MRLRSRLWEKTVWEIQRGGGSRGRGGYRSAFFLCDPTAVLSGRFTTPGRKGTKCARYTHTQQVREGRKRKGGGGIIIYPHAGRPITYGRGEGNEGRKNQFTAIPKLHSNAWYIANGTFLKGGENAFSGRLFVRRGTCLLTNEVLSTKVLLFPSSSFLRPPNGTQQERDSFISVPSSLFLCCRRRFEWAFSLRRLNIYPSKRMGVGTSLWLSHLS